VEKEVAVDKRLYRSQTDKIIGGVCGGAGEYFNVDPVFIRIVAVLLFFAHGIGLLAYIIAWIIMPKKRGVEAAEGAKEAEKRQYSAWNKYIPGVILIVVGLVFLVREYYWWWHIERYWPLVFVIIGLFLIFRSVRKQAKEETIHEPGQI
jgi:phage shock protein C